MASTFTQDLRFGLRLLKARPGVALLAILTLALGIGLNTAIFSVINSVLLRPLDFDHPDRLVMVWGTEPALDVYEGGTSLPDFFDWKREVKSFDGLASYVRWQYNVMGEENPERIWGGMVSHHFFDVMATPPLLGRGFTAEEDRPGAERVVMLSHGLWQSMFAGDPNILGKTMRVDDNLHTIVGVMPESFEFPSRSSLWTPLALGPDSYPRNLQFMTVVGRLRQDVSLDSAQDELASLVGRLAEEYPETNAGRGVRLVELSKQLVKNVRPALLMLAAASVFVLLIACANVMNLLLSQGARRRGELALRRALGATRKRLTAQLLTESAVLALAGGALGLGFAVLGVDALVALSRQNLPSLAEVGVDGRVLAFTLVVSMVTIMLVAIVPILRFSSERGDGSLGTSQRGSTASSGNRRLQAALVVAQVAIALSLVIGASLLVRSLLELRDVDTGFRASGVLTMELALPWSKYTQVHQTSQFYAELLQKISNLPGVESAGAIWTLPLSGGATGAADFEIDNRELAGDSKLSAHVQAVSEGTFETLGVPLLRGRAISSRDDAEAPPVVMVNETMARRFWPDGDPLGDHLSFDVDFGPVGNLPFASREIVGVVRDFKTTSLESGARAEIFFPFRQATWRMMSIAVRHTGEADDLAPLLRRQVWAVDPVQPVSNLRSLEQIRSTYVAQPQFNAMLLSLFAGIALVLSIVGIFGVISYSVSTRTDEIGLRMALGASRETILKQIVGEGLKLTLIGLACGLLAAFILTRTLSGLLFGVTTTDPLTFAGAVACCVLAALVASYLPARRATRVDPIAAIRHE